MKQYKKYALSLIEIVIWFLVLTLVLASSIRLVSKKILHKSDFISHGVYMCYWKDGVLHEALYSGKNMKQKPIYDRETQKCVFNPPKKFALYQVIAIGGGGGGGDAGYNGGMRISGWKKSKDIDPFNVDRDQLINEYNINPDELYGEGDYSTDYSGKIYFYAKAGYGTRSGEYIVESPSSGCSCGLDCVYDTECCDTCGDPIWSTCP